MRNTKPTPYSPARTLRDSKLNLPAISSGPTTAREFGVPGPQTLKNIEVPTDSVVETVVGSTMPTDSIVETVVQPPGTPIPERARGSTIPPGVDPAVDRELEDAFGLAVDQVLPADEDEPGLTVEIEDPRPTSEISAMQDVEGLMDGIPSGLASEDAPDDDGTATRSPRTRSSPNLAELWSSELERSTAQRAAVEARTDVHDAETVVAVTSSEALASDDSMTGATTITSRRRPTTNTKLVPESTRASMPEPAPAPAPKPLPVFKPIAPPPARDDDDDDGGLLGTFGLDIHVNIDVAFESDPGPAPIVVDKAPPPPLAIPEPLASESSGHSKRSNKRSGAVTKPPLAEASAKIEPVERRDRTSQRTIDTPSRRSSDKIDRSSPVETSSRATPVPTSRSAETSSKSGRTPSARSIERAIDRQMAGQDPDAPSRAWLYILLVLALGGAGVLGYLKYF